MPGGGSSPEHRQQHGCHRRDRIQYLDDVAATILTKNECTEAENLQDT